MHRKNGHLAGIGWQRNWKTLTAEKSLEISSQQPFLPKKSLTNWPNVRVQSIAKPTELFRVTWHEFQKQSPYPVGQKVVCWCVKNTKVRSYCSWADQLCSTWKAVPALFRSVELLPHALKTDAFTHVWDF